MANEPTIDKNSLRMRRNAKKWYKGNKEKVKRLREERKAAKPEICKLQCILSFMKQRCFNPKNKSYLHYGGRGITICDEWVSDSGLFYKWAFENGYQIGLELDRIDNNKGYSPENCRWVTHSVNCNNRRTSIMITYNGETMSIKDWANKLNIKYATIKRRMEIYGRNPDFLFMPLKSNQFVKPTKTNQ